MEEAIEGYDEATKTFYVAKTLTASTPQSALVVYVPATAKMVSIDVAVSGTGNLFSIYVTNSTYAEAQADDSSVLWHPTVHTEQTESLFATKSACAGAYMIMFASGTGIVKVRAK